MYGAQQITLEISELLSQRVYGNLNSSLASSLQRLERACVFVCALIAFDVAKYALGHSLCVKGFWRHEFSSHEYLKLMVTNLQKVPF